MPRFMASDFMRTTIDIDAPILLDLKRSERREGKSLGRLVSALRVQSLAAQGQQQSPPLPFLWASQAMGARIDLRDRDALCDDRDFRKFAFLDVRDPLAD
jgi:hypothetical protein